MKTLLHSMSDQSVGTIHVEVLPIFLLPNQNQNNQEGIVSIVKCLKTTQHHKPKKKLMQPADFRPNFAVQLWTCQAQQPTT